MLCCNGHVPELGFIGRVHAVVDLGAVAGLPGNGVVELLKVQCGRLVTHLAFAASSFQSEKYELVEVERVRYFVLCLVYFGGQSNDGGGAEFVEV